MEKIVAERGFINSLFIWLPVTILLSGFFLSSKFLSDGWRQN